MRESSYEQTIGGHLDDLRSILIKCVGVYSIALVFSVVFFRQIATFYIAPYMNVVNQGYLKSSLDIANKPANQFYFHSVTGPFAFASDIVMFTALIISAPFLIYFAWTFIRPGLFAKERQMAEPYLVVSIFLTSIAILYGYNIMMPVGLRAFSQFQGLIPDTTFALTPEAYIDFVKLLFTGLIFTFQIPIVIFIIIRTQVIPIQMILKNRKYLYFGIMVALFVLIPGDITVSALVALPVIVLFELAMLLARIGLKPRKEYDEELDYRGVRQ